MKIKIEGGIYFDPDSVKYANHPDIWPPYTFRQSTKNSYGELIFVAPHAIEAEIPNNFDPRPGMVEALRKKREEVQREFSAKVMEIDQRINSLLAIENSAEAVPA